MEFEAVVKGNQRKQLEFGTPLSEHLKATCKRLHRKYPRYYDEQLDIPTFSFSSNEGAFAIEPVPKEAVSELRETLKEHIERAVGIESHKHEWIPKVWSNTKVLVQCRSPNYHADTVQIPLRDALRATRAIIGPHQKDQRLPRDEKLDRFLREKGCALFADSRGGLEKKIERLESQIQKFPDKSKELKKQIRRLNEELGEYSIRALLSP